MNSMHPIPIKERIRKSSGSREVDSPVTFFEEYEATKNREARRKQAALIADLTGYKLKKAAGERELRVLFFLIGLTLSLALVLAAFEWKFYDRDSPVELTAAPDDRFEDMLDIPQTEQLPPPPPVQNQAVVITEVSDDIEIEELKLNFDVEVTEDMSIEDPVPFVLEEPLPEEEVEEVFVIVETRPEPVGGMQAFYDYLNANLKYPAEARQMRISGRVYVQFIVEKDGSISNIEVVKGIGGGCDEEAVRVLGNAPAWKPGKQRGRPVKVKMTIPIFFTISG